MTMPVKTDSYFSLQFQKSDGSWVNTNDAPSGPSAMDNPFRDYDLEMWSAYANYLNVCRGGVWRVVRVHTTVQVEVMS